MNLNMRDNLLAKFIEFLEMQGDEESAVAKPEVAAPEAALDKPALEELEDEEL